jgi:3-oxoacyl-[acyl-carrier-protein] synthase-3
MRDCLESVAIRGVVSSVPEKIVKNSENPFFSQDDIEKIIESAGVHERRELVKGCASDLSYHAAATLLSQLGWPADSVDGLLFVSQTPDYRLPSTACVLQHKLGLHSRVLALDINLGCSGYTYGLIVAGGLIASGVCKRVLLLTADAISTLVSEEDRSVALLFGDAGAATALEYDAFATPLYYHYGTDGEGFDRIIVPAGGARHPTQAHDLISQCDAQGNKRAPCHIKMSGADVFGFTLKEVPPTINAVMASAQWLKEEVDYFFLHQANAFMLKHLAKKMQISLKKLPLVLNFFGNTSVASIPLCMTETVNAVRAPLKLILSGFGVGFSWASVAFELSPTVLFSTIVYVES